MKRAAHSACLIASKHWLGLGCFFKQDDMSSCSLKISEFQATPHQQHLDIARGLKTDA